MGFASVPRYVDFSVFHLCRALAGSRSKRTNKTGCHRLQGFIVPADDKLSQDQKFGEIFSYIFRCVALVVGGRESLKRGLRNAAPLA